MSGCTRPEYTPTPPAYGRLAYVTKLHPNPEQERILDAFDGEDDIIIEAGAGTGKTSTLIMMTDEYPNLHYLYIAFNNAVVQEAKGRFHRRVRVSTAHALAMSWMYNSTERNERLIGKLNDGFHYDHVVAGRLFGGKFKEYVEVETETKTRTIGPLLMSRMALAALRQYCQSAEGELGPQHLVRPETLSPEVWEGHARAALAPYVVPGAQRALEDVWDPSGETVQFTHETYLKLWQLSHPELSKQYDVILLDEAQDASPVIADVVMRQQGRSQLVMVGDSSQAIYGWTGAVDALKLFQAAHPQGRVLPLTHSYRFGAEVAASANKVLEALGSEMQLVGAGGPSKVELEGEPFAGVDAVLVRTNAGGIKEALAATEAGLLPALKADTKSMLGFFTAAQKLIGGKRSQHPALEGFGTWGEFEEFVDRNHSAAAEYGLLTSLIDAYGVDALVRLLTRVQGVSEARADVVISTAHKVKGLEWDRVRLGEDFSDEVVEPAELMLVYVALTRAREVLLPGKLWPLTQFGVPLSEVALWRLQREHGWGAPLVKAINEGTGGKGDPEGVVGVLRTRSVMEPPPERPRKQSVSTETPAPKRGKPREGNTREERGEASTGPITVVQWRRWGHNRLYVNGPEDVRLGSANVLNGEVTVEEGADEGVVWAAIEGHEAWQGRGES